MKLRCKTPGCKVAETGKCLEGFEVGECPHLIQDEEDIAEDEAAGPENDDDEISVASGEFLNLEEATDVLQSAPSRVLAIIGPSHAGKTTFTLSIYDAFQHGPFAGCDFSTSRTLPGFEMRCHLSRAASGAVAADTPRTPLGEGLGFLHIEVIHNSTRINLLLSERSGEHYELIADNLEDCTDLHEINRADSIFFFVDGSKLASDENRHGVKNDILVIARSLVESDQIKLTQRIAVVLTKLDFVENSPHRERCFRDFDDLINKIKKLFPEEQEVSTFRIAARSEYGNIPHRAGVPELLQYCLRMPAIVKQPVSVDDLPARYFLRVGALSGGSQ